MDAILTALSQRQQQDQNGQTQHVLRHHHTCSFSSGILDWISCRGLCCCCQCCCLNTGWTGAVIYPRSGRWLENPMLKCFWVKEEVWLHLCKCETKAPNLWAERKTGGGGKKWLTVQKFQFYPLRKARGQ